jgi:uncharacterized protein (DUF1015 family)
MADLAPFRAWKYDFDRAGSPQELLAPPYDVIGHQRAREMAATSPYHVIHLILGKPEPGTSFTEEDYRRAADTWDEWREEKVLIREPRPVLYLYDIEFQDLVSGEPATRRGIVGTLKLEPFEAGVILPHEEVFPGPLSDRINLMRAADAIFSPIFGLHDDPGREAMGAIESSSPEPMFEVTDEDGCVHRVARIADPDAIAAYREALAGQQVILADGHHRYTAALEYARSKGRLGGDGAGARTMICLTASGDPGLRAYGTHRLFSGLGEAPSLEPLESVARITPLDSFDAATAVREVEAAPADRPTYVFVTRESLRKVVIEDPDALGRRLEGVSEDLYNESLTLLHRGLLPMLSVGADDLDVAGGVTHCRDAGEALEAVRTGQFDMGIIVRAPGGAELTEICAAGERMPHKSTYFYPKLLSGCAFHDLSGSQSH